MLPYARFTLLGLVIVIGFMVRMHECLVPTYTDYVLRVAKAKADARAAAKAAAKAAAEAKAAKTKPLRSRVEVKVEGCPWDQQPDMCQIVNPYSSTVATTTTTARSSYRPLRKVTRETYSMKLCFNFLSRTMFPCPDWKKMRKQEGFFSHVIFKRSERQPRSLSVQGILSSKCQELVFMKEKKPYYLSRSPKGRLVARKLEDIVQTRTPLSTVIVKPSSMRNISASIRR